MKKKEYCTQNNGNCETCSLVNYGRDCCNNPTDDTVMIGISRKLRDALKAKCAQQGRKIKETVEELIEKFIKAK